MKQVSFLVKVFLHLIPALGASMALCDMVVLIKKMLDSSHVQYHEWLFRFSQFSVWVSYALLYHIMDLFAKTPISHPSGILFQATILLVLKCGYCYVVCCNPILCVWWMLKFLISVPHLQRDFTSLQVQLVIHRKFYMACSAPSFLKWWTCWICEIYFLQKFNFYVLVNALISFRNVPTSKYAGCCCTSESGFSFFITFNSNSCICWVLVFFCALILYSSKNVFSRLV